MAAKVCAPDGHQKHIRLHNQDIGLTGLMVYKERVYAVHLAGLVVYCFNPDGSQSERYEHDGGAKTCARGMCMVMNGDTVMLIVSDWTNRSLVWISVSDDGTMNHRHTQELNYWPGESYNDKGNIMICDAGQPKIHRYNGYGQPLSDITLPDDVIARSITHYCDGEHYVITTCFNHQMVVINAEGQVKRRFKGDINGVKMENPVALTTDRHDRILVVDNYSTVYYR